MEWNWAHVHIAINHIPIIGVPIVLIFLLIGLVMRNQGLVKVSMYGFGILGFITLFVAGAGAAAQGIVNDELINAELFIHRHKIAAFMTGAVVVILGVWSTIGAASFSKASRSQKTIFSGGSTVLAVVAIGMLFWTAQRGTMINHPEVVAGEAPVARYPTVFEGEAARQQEAAEESIPSAREENERAIPPLRREPAAE